MKANTEAISMRKHIMLIMMGVILAVGLCFTIGAQGSKAYAAVEPQDFNGITWEITNDGVLKLSQTSTTGTTGFDGSGMYTDLDWDNIGENGVSDPGDTDFEVEMKKLSDKWPWKQHAADIRSVVITGDIKLSGDVSFLFAGLTNVDSISGLDNLDTSDVTGMSCMFGYAISKTGNCYGVKVTDLDLSSWDVHNITSARMMFQGCTSLESVNLSGWDTRAQGTESFSKLRSIDGMFGQCWALKNITIGNNFDTSSVVMVGGMFKGCRSLESVDLFWLNSEWISTASELFSGCTSLKEIKNLDKLNTRYVSIFYDMFRDCSSLTSLDVSNIDTGNATSFTSMFYGCSNLESISGLNNWNTKNVKSMPAMFSGCSALLDADVSGFDTGNVTNMMAMFQDCSSLTSIDASGWNVSNVENMYQMFRGCSNLQTLDASGWNCKNVRNMSTMFFQDSNLTEIKGMDTWGCSKVENTNLMFFGCGKLKAMGMLEFDMAALTTSNNTFNGCKGLEEALKEMAATETDLDKAALYTQAANKLGELKAGKTDGEALDLYADARDYYSQAMVAQSIADARNAIDVSVTTEEAAAADPTDNTKRQDALNALKEAYNAIDRAQRLAGNTRTNGQDDREVAELKDQFKNRSELNQKERFAEELANGISEASNIDTGGKSAKSVKDLEDAITNAGKVLEDLNSTALDIDKAKGELENAKAGLTNKSAAERAYDAANSTAKTAIAEAETAKAAYDDAKATADDAKATADDAKATADQSGTLADFEAAAKAAKDAENAIENAKKLADDFVTKAEAAKNATADAYDKAIHTDDPTIRNNANKQDGKAKAMYDEAFANAVAAGEAVEAAKRATIDAEAARAAKAAEEAQKAAEEALAKAREEAAKNPGSDAAIKAAEEANAKAAEAQKAAADAVTAAEATGDQARIDAAREIKAAADKTKADASLLEAEQKTKKAEALADSNPGSDAAKNAAADAQKAAEQAVADNAAAYGPTSPQVQAAQETLAKANATVQKAGIPVVQSSAVGTTFIYAKNKYRITQIPGETWDGEVALITAKNAKSVSVPKSVTYSGKRYEVSSIGSKAFRAKKIRSVTIGANVEKITKNAFYKSKATTVTVKTKSLTKARVKGALKGSKVKTVKVKVGTKKVNKKYVKKYKKIFTKKNAGKKVTVR